VLEKERSNAPKSKGMKSRSITDFLAPLPTTLTTVPVPEKLPAADEETPIEVNQQTGIDLAETTPENLNDAEKIRLIENVWKPPCNYNFPQNDEIALKRHTKACQYSWLEKYISWSFILILRLIFSLVPFPMK